MEMGGEASKARKDFVKAVKKRQKASATGRLGLG